MRPDEYGVQSGEIVAEPEGGEPVRVRLDTFVFP